ncbi:consortin isoform X1 [Scleropages formosus]|uniref:Consortin, connexin sorting protein a n=1 Tax=Scleropages formosus TaxID=113540 RepID=A0A8C9S702_SCLFO|nr:consortin isoform X1 [Scleropages formosus]
MDEGHCRSEEEVSHGPGRLTDLQNNVNCWAGPDENQNQLTEEGEEGMDEGLQSGWQLLQQDSVNNNEEEEEEEKQMHNNNRVSNEDTRSQIQHSPAHSEGCSRDTWTTGAVSVRCCLECPATGAPSHPEQVPTTGPPTGPHAPSSTLSPVASLQELLEHSDHTLLPQCLHQIAEAYFLEEEYEWALQFLQLERLYHERLLSNLAALQGQWAAVSVRVTVHWDHHWNLSLSEFRWKESNSSKRNSTDNASAELRPEQLETLTHICRTHQRSTLRGEKGLVVDGVLRNSLFSGRLSKHGKQHTTSIPCGPDSNSESSQMMEPLGLDEGSPAEDVLRSGALAAQHKDISALGHQGAELHGTLRLATPTSADTVGCCPEAGVRVGGEEKGLCEAAAAEALCDAGMESPLGDTLPGSSSPGDEEQEEGRTDPTVAFQESLDRCDSGNARRTEPGRDRSLEEDGAGSVGGEDKGGTGSGLSPLAEGEMSSPEPWGQEDGEGGEQACPGADEEKPEIVEVEVLEESLEYEVEEDSLGVDVVEEERVSQALLDDLAKRIQVEEITPASGLVSILKRRASLDSTTTCTGPTSPKQAAKRKVRFREPDEMLDQDEVGGDSWLLLLLLCLATVVISIGGTALYCTLGDVQSSICTDFSHNMDFYFGRVQRGLDELGHWFSPRS